jgi:2-hydroxy-6-oxonona-2,4-dienedioate hydrolase
MKAGFVDAAGLSTRILEAGEGPALLLLHPVGLSADIWLRNIDALAEAGRRVIAIDSPNHGFTDLVEYGERTPQELFARHALAVADALGIDRFSVAGSSLGGHVAALMYFLAPARVERLVVIGSGTAFSPEAELAQSLPRTFENAMKAIAAPTWAGCRARMANMCFSAASVPEEVILGQLTSYARPGMREAYEATLRGLMDMPRQRPHRILERLERIAIPVLILWGRQDSRSKVENASAASPRIPDCDLSILEDCGHLPCLEYPEQFNALLVQFLERPARSH